MLGKLKLATKFSLLLSLVFIGGILISGVALSNALEQQTEAEISYRGQILMQMVNSVREYTNSRVNPLLASRLKTEAQFIPEAIPSFSAREVFETLRKNKEYANFLYKDATLNPTNPRDQADEFEANLIDRFRKEGISEISGFRDLAGEKVFFSARPLSIKKPSCLVCHSTPEAAPKSLLATYGTKNGFGWPLNKVIDTQIIYVPASKVFDSVKQAFTLISSIFIGIFALAVFVINWLLKQNVIQPIRPLAKLAQQISSDTMTADKLEDFDFKGLMVVARRADELGQLGRIFQNMAREVYLREQRLKQQVQELRIEIDDAKRRRQVAEIAETDYFQNLNKQAAEIRSKWEKTEGDQS